MQRRHVLKIPLLAWPMSAAPALSRPAKWAIPYPPPGLPGVTNLSIVTPKLFRSAQPTTEGFSAIEKTLHVRTVVNLHDEGPDGVLAPNSKMTFVQVKTNSFRIFSNHNAKLLQALHEIRKGLELGPVLVHCVHGSDRTGAAIAAWRMVEQGWSAEEAVAEMKGGGFGYHSSIFSNGRLLMRLDVSDMKKRLNDM